MRSFLKPNLLPKLFFLWLVMPLAVGCQTGTAPKTSENKNQTATDADRAKNAAPAANAIVSPPVDITVVTKSDVAQKGSRIEDFAPKNWYLMMKAEGDLNGDGTLDAVAAFSKAKIFDGEDASTRSSEQPDADVNADRVLIVALRDADGTLNLSDLSQKIILCRTCGAQMDDTLLGLAIKNNAIEIKQGALGTSAVDYLHKIKKDPKAGWVVFYGEVINRYRATGIITKAKQKSVIALDDFDIVAETEKLSLAADQTVKTKH